MPTVTATCHWKVVPVSSLPTTRVGKEIKALLVRPLPGTTKKKKVPTRWMKKECCSHPARPWLSHLERALSCPVLPKRCKSAHRDPVP